MPALPFLNKRSASCFAHNSQVVAIAGSARCYRLWLLIAMMLMALLTTATVSADRSLDLKVSVGATFQAKNDVQIPNTSEGDRFALDDITGTGPWPAARLEALWDFNSKHGVRILLAPLSYSETGDISAPIRFAGATFNADQPVRGEYRFNSWRLGYRYQLRDTSQWDAWVGATLKVRDAQIKLTQGDTSSQDDNIGLVPLLYLAGEYRFNNRWSASADMDALAGGPGRAIDVGLALNFRPVEAWQFGVEYRALEGGADTDRVYNFAWFNYLLLTARFSR